MIHADVDLEEAVEAGNATATVTTNQMTDENETFFEYTGYFNALTKSCAEKIDSEWQGKLEGAGVWTDEH